MAPRDGTGVAIISNRLCTFTVFGKVNTSILVQLGISPNANWSTLRRRCLEAGYKILETSWQLDWTDVNAAKKVTIEWEQGKWKEEVSFDYFRAEQYAFRTCELPKKAMEYDEIELKVSVDGITKRVKIPRKYWAEREKRKQVNANIYIESGSKVKIKQQDCIIVGEDTMRRCRSVDSGLGFDSEEYAVFLNLGVGVNGCLMDDVIELNTSIPTKKSRTYSTSEDDQTSGLFAVYEGQSPLVKNNKLLTELVIEGIPPGPCDKEEITLTMEIDDQGDLSITAQSVSTKKSVSKKISYFELRASKEKAEKMILQAEENKVADDAERDRIQSWQKLQIRAYELKWKMKDETKNPEIPKHRRETVVGKCEEVIAWTWQNKDKEKSEYEEKLADLDRF